MASGQKSNLSGRESMGYILVAGLLMLLLIFIAVFGPDDSERQFDLTMKNLSRASLGVPNE